MKHLKLFIICFETKFGKSLKNYFTIQICYVSLTVELTHIRNI